MTATTTCRTRVIALAGGATVLAAAGTAAGLWAA